MQTNISNKYRTTSAGREADEILRSCVHCGFCLAACPTYQLLGDELDSPRGRIYLIKQILEGNAATEKTQLHLDRCLTCRSCETTCPSGVRYGRLVDIGRELIEREVGRSSLQSIKRSLLRSIVPFPKRFSAMIGAMRLIRPLLPAPVRQKLPARQTVHTRPRQKHQRRMLVLEGCAQSVVTPRTNSAAAQVLDKLGIELLSAAGAGCCGALSYHLAATGDALNFMRRNIDAWWPYVGEGIEAIVVTASGCGVVVKEYGELLKHDDKYALKAKRISELTRDISEIIRTEGLMRLKLKPQNKHIAFQNPCTLQHGLKLEGVVEDILIKAGFNLVEVEDAHLCCGSAGSYSILQPEISQQLLANKLTALQKNKPDVIVTANVGCQLYLATGAGQPVKHWIELIDDSATV